MIFSKIIQSSFFKYLSSKYRFFDFIKSAQYLYWQHNKNITPIYLEYPINPIPRYGHGKPPHPILDRIIRNNKDQYIALINEFKPFSDYLNKIPYDKPSDPLEPYWGNNFISGLEAISLYCFPILFRSKLYIEIGSGNSTKFIKKTIKENFLETKIISIDPHPRAEIDLICDEVIRTPLEEVDLKVFDALEEGDIIMIDNSHRCFQNSDVTVVFLDILPNLKSGVLIYIDDIFIPNDYPPVWQSHFYSEQYLLAVLLMADTTRYEIILPCSFIGNDKQTKDLVEHFWQETNLISAKGYGNGFWMRVK